MNTMIGVPQPIARAKPVRRGGKTVEIGVVAAMLYPLSWLLASGDIPTDIRTTGAVLWCLCLLPAIQYVFGSRRARRPFPFLALVGVMYGTYFALPAVAGQANLNYVPFQAGVPYIFPDTDYERPMRLALEGWCALLVGYGLLRMFRMPPARQDRAWPARALVPWLFAIAFVGIGTQFAQDTISLPRVLGGLLFFFTVLSRFALALLLVWRARGILDKKQRAVMWLSITILVVLWITSGSIGKIFLLLIFFVLAHSLGGGRVPLRAVVLGVVGMLTVTTIKGILPDYRRLVWFGAERLNVVDRAGLLVQLINDKVDERGVSGAIAGGLTASANRTATLDLLADVVRRTPRDVPYLNGTTYLSLVGALVPRVLWPGKPTKTLGQLFGHRYGYLYDLDTSTSINLPILVEFYINFGESGVILGMLLVGVIYAVLDYLLNRRGQNIVHTVMGMAILIPLLDLESDFSLVFGGLVLDLVAFSLVLRFLWKQMPVAARAKPAEQPRDARFIPGTVQTRPS